MITEGITAKKVFVNLSVDEDVNDESEFTNSTIDDNDMYQNIFANDSNSSDGDDFTCSIDDKELILFLRSKSIKELKLLAEHHKISLVNVIEKQDLIARLAIDPTLKICVSKDMSAKQAGKVKERKRSQKVDPLWWEEIEVKEVEKLPYDIDGTYVFKLSFDPEDRLKSSTDGRSWGKSYTSNTKEFPNAKEKQRGVLVVTHAQTIYVCFTYNMEKKTTCNGKKNCCWNPDMQVLQSFNAAHTMQGKKNMGVLPQARDCQTFRIPHMSSKDPNYQRKVQSKS